MPSVIKAAVCFDRILLRRRAMGKEEQSFSFATRIGRYTCGQWFVLTANSRTKFNCAAVVNEFKADRLIRLKCYKQMFRSVFHELSIGADCQAF